MLHNDFKQRVEETVEREEGRQPAREVPSESNDAWLAVIQGTMQSTAEPSPRIETLTREQMWQTKDKESDALRRVVEEAVSGGRLQSDIVQVYNAASPQGQDVVVVEGVNGAIFGFGGEISNNVLHTKEGCGDVAAKRLPESVQAFMLLDDGTARRLGKEVLVQKGKFESINAYECNQSCPLPAVPQPLEPVMKLLKKRYDSRRISFLAERGVTKKRTKPKKKPPPPEEIKRNSDRTRNTGSGGSFDPSVHHVVSRHLVHPGTVMKPADAERKDHKEHLFRVFGSRHEFETARGNTRALTVEQSAFVLDRIRLSSSFELSLLSDIRFSNWLKAKKEKINTPVGANHRSVAPFSFKYCEISSGDWFLYANPAPQWRGDEKVRMVDRSSCEMYLPESLQVKVDPEKIKYIPQAEWCCKGTGFRAIVADDEHESFYLYTFPDQYNCFEDARSKAEQAHDKWKEFETLCSKSIQESARSWLSVRNEEGALVLRLDKSQTDAARFVYRKDRHTQVRHDGRLFTLCHEEGRVELLTDEQVRERRDVDPLVFQFSPVIWGLDQQVCYGTGGVEKHCIFRRCIQPNIDARDNLMEIIRGRAKVNWRDLRNSWQALREHLLSADGRVPPTLPDHGVLNNGQEMTTTQNKVKLGRIEFGGCVLFCIGVDPPEEYVKEYEYASKLWWKSEDLPNTLTETELHLWEQNYFRHADPFERTDVAFDGAALPEVFEQAFKDHAVDGMLANPRGVLERLHFDSPPNFDSPVDLQGFRSEVGKAIVMHKHRRIIDHFKRLTKSNFSQFSGSNNALQSQDWQCSTAEELGQAALAAEKNEDCFQLWRSGNRDTYTFYLDGTVLKNGELADHLTTADGLRLVRETKSMDRVQKFDPCNNLLHFIVGGGTKPQSDGKRARPKQLARLQYPLLLLADRDLAGFKPAVSRESVKLTYAWFGFDLVHVNLRRQFLPSTDLSLYNLDTACGVEKAQLVARSPPLFTGDFFQNKGLCIETKRLSSGVDVVNQMASEKWISNNKCEYVVRLDSYFEDEIAKGRREMQQKVADAGKSLEAQKKLREDLMNNSQAKNKDQAKTEIDKKIKEFERTLRGEYEHPEAEGYPLRYMEAFSRPPLKRRTFQAEACNKRPASPVQEVVGTMPDTTLLDEEEESSGSNITSDSELLFP